MDIALLDARQEDIAYLSGQLTQYAAMNDLRFVLRAFSRGEDLMKDYTPHQYAVIFLDVFLDGMDGIDVARRIRDVDDDVCLVFITDSDAHQSQAIHFHVFDYLSKPAAPETVFGVMDRILRRRTALKDRRLSFVVKRTEHSISYDEITYISAERNYLIIHDRTGNAWRTRLTFSSIEKALAQDDRFLRLLRGLLVNMDYVTDISTCSCCLQGEIHLPVNVKNSRRIEQIWVNYQLSRVRRANLDGDALA